MNVTTTTVTDVTFSPGDTGYELFKVVRDLPASAVIEPHPGKLRFIHPHDH